MIHNVWVPIKLALKIRTTTIDNVVFRLHYRVTAFILVAAALLVTASQYFWKPIECVDSDRNLPQEFINTFCWSHSTFSVVEAFDEVVGFEVPYPGIKYRRKLDVVHHTYYQCVWFILFLQAGLFYFPGYLWKVWEGGIIESLTEGISYSVLTDQTCDAEKEKKIPHIVNYLTNDFGLHKLLVIQYIICEIANFVNVTVQTVLLSAFLGGGARILEFARMEKHPDGFNPMTRVFPRMTKCQIHYYGTSGDILLSDVLCTLPLNIINEKVFVFIWFWFVGLAAISALGLLYGFFVMKSTTMRYLCLKAQCTLADDHCLQTITSHISSSDWFILFLLTKNVQPMFMKDILNQLQCKIDKQRRDMEGNTIEASNNSEEGIELTDIRKNKENPRLIEEGNNLADNGCFIFKKCLPLCNCDES